MRVVAHRHHQPESAVQQSVRAGHGSETRGQQSEQRGHQSKRVVQQSKRAVQQSVPLGQQSVQQGHESEMVVQQSQRRGQQSEWAVQQSQWPDPPTRAGGSTERNCYRHFSQLRIYRSKNDLFHQVALPDVSSGSPPSGWCTDWNDSGTPRNGLVPLLSDSEPLRNGSCTLSAHSCRVSR